ncbi:AAA family ATPase, partial [Aeromonas caviae]
PSRKRPLKAQTIDELVKIKLENNTLQSEDTITDVGFGFSQVLPILIQGALLNPNELLIIEQPELHLHPNAQFLFAQVLCSMANSGVKLLIETHSEHLLRGIQLEISKEGANNRGNSSRLTQSFHFFSLSRFFLP